MTDPRKPTANSAVLVEDMACDEWAKHLLETGLHSDCEFKVGDDQEVSEISNIFFPLHHKLLTICHVLWRDATVNQHFQSKSAHHSSGYTSFSIQRSLRVCAYFHNLLQSKWIHSWYIPTLQFNLHKECETGIIWSSSGSLPGFPQVLGDGTL